MMPNIYTVTIVDCFDEEFDLTKHGSVVNT